MAQHHFFKNKDMAKIIIVMISRLREDPPPPLFGDVRRASEKEKKIGRKIH